MNIYTAASVPVKPVFAFKKVINLLIFAVMNEPLSHKAWLRSEYLLSQFFINTVFFEVF